MAVVIEVLVLLLFLAGLSWLYVWARRTEADVIYQPRATSADEANSLRPGMALDTPTANLGGP